jgi:hypothetical protein
MHIPICIILSVHFIHIMVNKKEAEDDRKNLFKNAIQNLG